MAAAQRRYLAFDIEIAKVLPADAEDLKAFRPLGICCAAALAGDDDQPHLWYSRETDGNPSPSMTRKDASDMVDFLLQEVEHGFTILTWNGLHFDFDILAEESGRTADCQNLALNHVDMMFHVFCEKGFPVSLDAAAKGIRLQGKVDGIDGKVVPEMWVDGKIQEVLDYVSNDCRLTLKVALASEYDREFTWITKRGTPSSFYLRKGWQSVSDARRLPEPDTSWMTTEPWPRSRFFDWYRQWPSHSRRPAPPDVIQ